MSCKRCNIVRKTLVFFARLTGIAALLILLLSSGVYVWNNQHNMEHFPAPAGKMFFPEKTSCHFAVMGDLVVNTAIFSRVHDAAKAGNPDFILLLGDIMPRHDQQIYNVSSRQLKKILKSDMICPIPGNHDVAEKGEDADHLRHYRTLFGAGSYFFTYGDTLFYAFDNSQLTYSDADFEQLRNTLVNLRSRYRNFVFYMHVPPSTVNLHHRRNKMDKTFSDRLEKLLKEFHVSVIFCGHLHQYMETRYADAPLYVVRPSGQGEEWGYLDVKIADGKIQVRDVAVPYDGCRLTLFPDWEEFKLVQVCACGNFVLTGIVLLIVSLGLRIFVKFFRD